jgi:hypothetical protein
MEKPRGEVAVRRLGGDHPTVWDKFKTWNPLNPTSGLEKLPPYAHKCFEDFFKAANSQVQGKLDFYRSTKDGQIYMANEGRPHPFPLDQLKKDHQNEFAKFELNMKRNAVAEYANERFGLNTIKAEDINNLKISDEEISYSDRDGNERTWTKDNIPDGEPGFNSLREGIKEQLAFWGREFKTQEIPEPVRNLLLDHVQLAIDADRAKRAVAKGFGFNAEDIDNLRIDDRVYRFDDRSGKPVELSAKTYLGGPQEFNCINQDVDKDIAAAKAALGATEDAIRAATVQSIANRFKKDATDINNLEVDNKLYRFTNTQNRQQIELSAKPHSRGAAFDSINKEIEDSIATDNLKLVQMHSYYKTSDGQYKLQITAREVVDGIVTGPEKSHDNFSMNLNKLRPEAREMFAYNLYRRLMAYTLNDKAENVNQLLLDGEKCSFRNKTGRKVDDIVLHQNRIDYIVNASEPFRLNDQQVIAKFKRDFVLQEAVNANKIANKDDAVVCSCREETINGQTEYAYYIVPQEVVIKADETTEVRDGEMVIHTFNEKDHERIECEAVKQYMGGLKDENGKLYNIDRVELSPDNGKWDVLKACWINNYRVFDENGSWCDIPREEYAEQVEKDIYVRKWPGLPESSKRIDTVVNLKSHDADASTVEELEARNFRLRIFRGFGYVFLTIDQSANQALGIESSSLDFGKIVLQSQIPDNLEQAQMYNQGPQLNSMYSDYITKRRDHNRKQLEMYKEKRKTGGGSETSEYTAHKAGAEALEKLQEKLKAQDVWFKPQQLEWMMDEQELGHIWEPLKKFTDKQVEAFGRATKLSKEQAIQMHKWSQLSPEERQEALKSEHERVKEIDYVIHLSKESSLEEIKAVEEWSEVLAGKKSKKEVLTGVKEEGLTQAQLKALNTIKDEGWEIMKNYSSDEWKASEEGSLWTDEQKQKLKYLAKLDPAARKQELEDLIKKAETFDVAALLKVAPEAAKAA